MPFRNVTHLRGRVPAAESFRVSTDAKSVLFKPSMDMVRGLGWKKGDRIGLAIGEGQDAGLVEFDRNPNGWLLCTAGGGAKNLIIKISKFVLDMPNVPAVMKPVTTRAEVRGQAIVVWLPWGGKEFQGSDKGRKAASQNPVSAARSDSRSDPEGGRANGDVRHVSEPPESVEAPQAKDAGDHADVPEAPPAQEDGEQCSLPRSRVAATGPGGRPPIADEERGVPSHDKDYIGLLPRLRREPVVPEPAVVVVGPSGGGEPTPANPIAADGDATDSVTIAPYAEPAVAAETEQNAPGAFARESAEAEPVLQPSVSGAGTDTAAAPYSEDQPQPLPIEGSAAGHPFPKTIAEADRKFGVLTSNPAGWSEEKRERFIEAAARREPHQALKELVGCSLKGVDFALDKLRVEITARRARETGGFKAGPLPEIPERARAIQSAKSSLQMQHDMRSIGVKPNPPGPRPKGTENTRVLPEAERMVPRRPTLQAAPAEPAAAPRITKETLDFLRDEVAPILMARKGVKIAARVDTGIFLRNDKPIAFEDILTEVNALLVAEGEQALKFEVAA